MIEAMQDNDDFTDNEGVFDMMAGHVRIVAEDLLRKFWGERCPDFYNDCPLCQKWKQLDSLLENPLAEKPVHPSEETKEGIGQKMSSDTTYGTPCP